MAPDRTVVQRGEERSLLTAEEKGANPMKLARLDFAQHPRPPQHELRQRGVFDSGARLIGHVENIYVDDEGTFRFLDVVMGGFMGLGKKHHLVPVEAIAEEEPGSSITLTVDSRPYRAHRRWATRTPRQMRAYSVPPASSVAKNSGRWGTWE